MSEADVDRLIDERPGKELLAPVYDDPAYRLTDFSTARGERRPPTCWYPTAVG